MRIVAKHRLYACLKGTVAKTDECDREANTIKEKRESFILKGHFVKCFVSISVVHFWHLIKTVLFIYLNKLK